MIFRLALILCFSAYYFVAWANGDSWGTILENKEGTVKFYWYPNNVIIENSLDIIDGIEHDLAVSFVKYLEEKYQVNIDLEWIQTESFESVMGQVQNGSNGTFGASSISITPQRAQYFNFTSPYMADIAVLVSNANIPVALSVNQLGEILVGKTAVSIKNTTLIDALNKLKAHLNIEFEIEYTSNSGDILDQIHGRNEAFGYVDIANFLVAVDNNSNIKRQFFYPVKLDGLAMIYPKNSDWEVPVNDYFNSTQFNKDRQEIIRKYLGSNASEIINRISKSAEIGPLEEIVLSNREKEAQYERLLEAARRDQNSEIVTLVLASIIIVVLVVLGLLYALYRVKSKNNARLRVQRKLAEDANEQLRMLNEEKNNLIQILAHDLRSPLSNILNGSQIIESSEKLTDQGERLLGFILESSEKMRSMIDKVLDVDAIETGKLNIKNEVFALHEVIEQVVKQNAAKANDKFINIRTDFSEDLKVRADKVYSQQVIENLVSNAIKYSPINSQIKILARQANNMVRISVVDQGPGLTSDDQKKLFRKYQQLSAKPTKGEMSIGLGLSIVKLFTERMGGKVAYETEVNKGTTFHVYLKQPAD
ncbi:ATP-binding protein [Ekhidna sp. MALMAid0563]|uniref:ATP-binding protein n=1 Tax=Ekhidna sp. MALMAid0563 TaxID=3143937 RepID=UPI0032DF43E3